jgi:hypothetical protein
LVVVVVVVLLLLLLLLFLLLSMPTPQSTICSVMGASPYHYLV